ncbi:hypothetical protein [[Clostridium] polysaccharolyticum]|uniref:Uncharacterized protein n=1 Tax=[Clostridium] polysaccharolyticum TaxID=29364 RepID=A0A1I0B2Z9_9FIRM|nr:hypothetical protein [[Clostridium] polysaccharolyticum]SET00726.1 hypothetical protein SAMN04487772_106136 [[Clostridium] polysaccharolyticum]
MSANLRQLIKSLNSGKNLDKDLPAYLKALADEYHSYAMLQTMLQYYVMCEQHEEGYFKEKEVLDTVQVIHELIYELFVSEEPVQREACIQKLDKERTKVIRKMEVLTNYTDHLLISEYILNRIEHKYDQADPVSEDDTVFAQKLLQYIFAQKDNAVIGERIKEVIGQLPVRIARSKFYEMVKNSISLFKGGEKDSLDSYLYMIRTSATMYHPEGEGIYFNNWGQFVEKMDGMDYGKLEMQEIKALQQELQKMSEEFTAASEVFVTLQELLNSLYVYLLSEAHGNGFEERYWEKEEKICKDVIITIAKQVKSDDNYVIGGTLIEKLEQIEGVLEKVMMQIQQLMGSFEMIKETYAAERKELKLETGFADFDKAEKLLSTSIFVEFKEKSTEEVTEQMAEKEAVKLAEEFSELFHGASILFVRAVIANVMERMPVQFASVDEVSEYIQGSLQQCKDAAEKQAVYEILNRMITENA